MVEGIADLYRMRTWIYLDKKHDVGKAIAEYTEGLRLYPDYRMLYCDRGDIYFGKGDFDKAIADYSQAIRLAPKDDELYERRRSVC